MTIGSNASSLIQQQLPSFLEGGNLQLFLEAYYEWLETRQDSESQHVKQLFRSLPGPNALISDASINRDIDTTVDQFVRYFYDQVIPVVVQGTHVDTRFSIKKIRDLYLAKGTPNSFKLFFRMLYAEEIDVFFPKDSILVASNGKYLSFPQVRAVVTEGENILSFFNYQLATLYNDSDGIDKGILVVDGFALSNINGVPVINLTLNSGDINLDFERPFKLQDATNAGNNITLQILVQLEAADVISSGGGYEAGDTIEVFDPELFPVGVAELRVDSALPGPVRSIQIRDRGESYINLDAIRFTVNDNNNGQGGSAFITSVDPNGRIQAINGIMARTGPFNNGYLSDDFVNVNIPITDGGSYKVYPTTSVIREELNPAANPISTQRYNKLGGLVIQEAQLYAISKDIGRIGRVVPADPGFFQPSNIQNLRVQPPFNIVTGSNVDFPLGAILEFQYFKADSEGFTPDSEVLEVNITFKKQTTFTKTLRLPSYFDNDSENSSFQWYSRTYTFTRSRTIDSDKRIIASQVLPNYKHVYVANQDTQINDPRLYRLDGYHFDQLNVPAADLGFAYDDSDIKIEYVRNFQNPRIRTNLGPSVINPRTGQFISTGFGGRIARRNSEGNLYSLKPFTSILKFPTDSEIQAFDDIPFSILRVVQVNPLTGDQITQNAFPIADYVSQWYGNVNLDLKLSGPIYTAKRFINEDGFLDSPSGSVLRDNYFYSEYTYVLQSTKSIYEWGARVKQLLHPAGTILISEVNIETRVPAAQIRDIDVNLDVDNGLLQLDNSLDSFIADAVTYNLVTADTTVQAVSPYLLFNRMNANGLYIFTDNFGKNNQSSQWSQYGNAMWDYEPIGLINGFTTQSYNLTDSDGQGNHFVRNEFVSMRSPYNADSEDRYKGATDNILNRGDEATYNLYATVFQDTVNEKYTIYDVDRPGLQSHVWNNESADEDSYFDRIRYEIVQDSDYIDPNGKFRIKALFGSSRNSEIRLLRNIDLQTAMRLENELVFTDSEGEYYDFDAYERKWNTINRHRTINAQGWEIPGKPMQVQNIEAQDQLKYTDYNVSIQQMILNTANMYVTTKTPQTSNAFKWLDPLGEVNWREYYPAARRDSDGDAYYPPYPATINTLFPYVYGPFPRTLPPATYDIVLANSSCPRIDPNSIPGDCK